ncbi:hypothetical protein FJZ36_03875 [Candidatus Poribacteria bacterium]|nr:hypothetical protein [Candidatus Poribacteria bacterium]
MEPQLHRVRIRAALIGVLLILANSYWLGYVEMIWHTAHLTIVAVPVNVLFLLIVLTWANTVVRSAAPRLALGQSDLLVVYAMLATGSAFAGHDFMPRLMGLIPHAARYATTENDWEGLFFRDLPKRLVVMDTDAVQAFYKGGARFFSEGHYRAWVAPLLAWTCVVLLLMVCFLCISVLLREQWVNRERLAYPLIQVSYELTTDDASLFRHTNLWVGVGIAFGINLWNGIQYFRPALPEIPIKRYDLIQYVTDRPWNAIGSTPMRLHPLLIGLAFLLPLDLSFSVAFFYACRKLQHVFGSAFGVTVPGYPFLGEQGAGALLALVVVSSWSGRRHLARILIRVRHPLREAAHREAVTYRTAVVGLGIAVAALTVIFVASGMTIWGAWLFLGVYLSIVTGLTRMRTELGPPIHAIGYATPQHLLITAFGTRRFGTGNLTMLSMLNWLSGASYASFRTHPMPHQMEAFKLADRGRIGNRSMLFALMVAGVAGVVGSLILYPTLLYKEGVPGAAEQIHAGGWEAYTFLAGWLHSPRPPNWLAVMVLSLTFVVNLGIFGMRSRFFWCPLHPAGYVIGVAPGTTDILWFPLLIALVAKWSILRLAGFATYRRTIPFFMGLILGEALGGGMWPLVSLFTRTSVYSWM